MDKPLWMWALFLTIVLVLVVLDLGVFNRKDRAMGVKDSLKMSAFYITIGLAFGGWVWYSLGPDAGQDYITGYIVEKSLSMDNIFVMSLIFSYFAVPRQYEHRVLFWGIMGVIVLRGIMIGLGTAIIAQFSWVLYLFAAFLVFTGIKMLFAADDEPQDISQNKLLKFLRGHLPITETFHGNKFSVKLPHAENPKKKVRYYTPLFLAVCLIEVADIIFAVDSIPAIFAITVDPYIVYTSNIFAILGLRAMYFALSAMVHRFHYLKYSLSLVLVFIGGKVFASHLFDMGDYMSEISLAVTILLLAGGVVYSMIKTKQEEAK
jgi:tellurite resistance protein TerC